MKKIKFAICSLIIGCSVLPLAACTQTPAEKPCEHTYETKWSKDKNEHWHAPTCDESHPTADNGAHEFDEDHVCKVCGYTDASIGKLSVADVSAWSDVESRFKLVFADATKTEAVTYEYDKDNIVLDGEKCTVKSVEGFVGTAQVVVRSAHHNTVRFNVECKSLPAESKPQYVGYASQLGSGVLVDDNGNDTGARYAVTENTTVFIGDSFFDRRWFWKDFYTDDFNGKDAFLAGISGATTNDWEIYMDSVFAVFGDKAPKNIAIHLGTNNLGTGQTAAQTEEGLQHFLLKLHQKFPQTKIYYFSVTPRYDNGGPSDGTISQLNAQTQAWCKDNDFVRYIDTAWLLTRDKIQSDGIHPLIETYSVFVEYLQKAGCVIENKR